MVSLPTHHLMQGYPVLGTDTSHNSGGSLQRWTGVVTPAAPGMPGSHGWSKTLQVPRRHFSWAMNSCREHTSRLWETGCIPLCPVLWSASWPTALSVARGSRWAPSATQSEHSRTELSAATLFSSHTPRITIDKLSFLDIWTAIVTENTPQAEMLPRSNETRWKSYELRKRCQTIWHDMATWKCSQSCKMKNLLCWSHGLLSESSWVLTTSPFPPLPSQGNSQVHWADFRESPYFTTFLSMLFDPWTSQRFSQMVFVYGI